MEEKIFHMAGAKTPVGQTQAAFEKAILEAGRTPVARDTWYRRLAPREAGSTPVGVLPTVAAE
jgi:aminodeoxyfutalosine synthase